MPGPPAAWCGGLHRIRTLTVPPRPRRGRSVSTSTKEPVIVVTRIVNAEGPIHVDEVAVGRSDAFSGEDSLLTVKNTTWHAHLS